MCLTFQFKRSFVTLLQVMLFAVPSTTFAGVDPISPTSLAAWAAISGEGSSTVCSGSYGGKIQSYEDSLAFVQQVIENRSKSIQPGNPVIIDGAGLQTNVTNSLFLQFGSNVLSELRVRVFDTGTKILDRWKTQWRFAKEAEIRPRLNRAQSLANQSQLDFNGVGGLPNPMLDGQPLFPAINEILSDRSLIEKLSGVILDPEQIKVVGEAAATKKAGLKGRFLDLIAGKSSIKLGETFDFELQLQQELLLIRMKPYLEEIKHLGMRIANEFGERAAQQAMRLDPTNVPSEIRTWHAYMSLDPFVLARDWFEQAPRLIGELVSELRLRFPLGPLETKDQMLPGLIQKVDVLKHAKPKDWLEGLASPDGLELEIKSSKLYARYSPKLGATFLSTRPNPHTVNAHRPVFALWHGDGTTRSNVASWRSLLAFYEANGFNALAQSMPIAGGPRVSSMRDTITFLDESNQQIRKEIGPEQPLLVGGRSMGSAKGFLHSMLFGGKEDPVDAYFLISYSNPMTMELQTASVYQQVKAGLFSGLIKESLQSATRISKETLAMLKAAKSRNPKAFETFGNNIVFFQGDSDADGGPTVMEDLKAFLAEFAPLAHLREYHMPAAQREAYEKILRGEVAVFKDLNGNDIRVEEDMLEGQHFIHSNRDDNPVGAPKTQTLQSLADIYRFMDYLADGPGEGLQWPTERERLAQARFKASRAKSGAGYSFFKWYINDLKSRKVNIDETAIKNFVNPKSNTRDLNERFAYVDQDWTREKARVLKVYQKLGINLKLPYIIDANGRIW
jgi:hypothetical protein